MLPPYASHIGAIALEIRRELEGPQDASEGVRPGDLEQRLASIGLGGNPPPEASELACLTAEDRAARHAAIEFIERRAGRGIDRARAAREFIHETAYAWTNRLLALRCMEARGLIDGLIVQEIAHGGRSLQHQRLHRNAPERCTGEDEGLFAMLFDEFARQAAELPLLFSPSAPEVALRPSPSTLKRCLAILSGTDSSRKAAFTDDHMWRAPDALGWAHQHWHGPRKDHIFETLRTRKGEKIGGGDLIPATCVYTEPYIVQFLVQNSLGALWMGMHPRSRLFEQWEYYVRSADVPAVRPKPVRDIRFLDPACGSGHFLLEAFDLFYAMYLEEGELTDPQDICASILERNLHGIDIDERAVQVAALSLVMKAKEKAAGFVPRRVNIVSTHLCLPEGRQEVEAFLCKHPEDIPLKPALLAIFSALEHVDELGALVQIEKPIDDELQALQERQAHEERPQGPGAWLGSNGVDWASWKRGAIERLHNHFADHAAMTRPAGASPGHAASRDVSLVRLLGRRYDIVCMNPPYIGFRKLATHIKEAIAADDLAKLDIYVAFLSRFFALVDDGGSLAAVCPSSWTTSSSTALLRRKMLGEGGPRIAAALGQRVFEPAPLLFVSLQVIAKGPPRSDAYLVTLRPPPLSGAEGLARSARQARRKWPHAILRSLETVPFLPIAPEELLERAAGQPTVADFFSFADGIWTGNNDRDIREGWEIRPDDAAWVVTSGGQGYARWYAPTSRRLRSRYARDWPTREARSFALEYARVAGGKLSARLVTTPSASIAGVVSILPAVGTDRLRLFEAAAVFNCRLGTVWLRTLTSGLNFNPGYAGRVPLAPDPPPEALAHAVERVTALKQALATRELTSDDFLPSHFESALEGSIAARADAFCNDSLDLIARALEEEHHIELLLKHHLDLSAEAWAEIESELGAPAASLPFARDHVASPGAAAVLGTNNDDKDGAEGDARALPPESDLEELSRAYRVHPRAILSGARLPGALGTAFETLRAKRRYAFVADLISLMVLRLVCHRFPRESPSDDPWPEDPGEAGILPLAALPGERSLFERLTGRIAQASPTGDAATTLQEIAAILGKPLARWIESDFFRYQITRFGKRPVLWQIQSAKYAGSRRPALSILVYALSLHEMTLPTIRTLYIAPRQAALEAELLQEPPPDAQSRQDRSRRAEIQTSLDELRAFDTRLQGVIQAGFSCSALKSLAAAEPLNPWTSPDGRSPAPGCHDELAQEERRYVPQPRDGVRINIAPLQRAGLLAADVLAAKDVDRAIEDRAEWRAAERRSCRDGKLSKPDWWI